MSASWEVASATQIFRSGAAKTGTLATQVADHIGGSARVLWRPSITGRYEIDGQACMRHAEA
jgi:hypothetical protein